MDGIFDRFRVIDVDTHVSEPPDVFTARVPAKWGDRVPHVVRRGRKDVWVIGDQPVLPAGITATAGFDGLIPDFPDTYEDMPAAAWDAGARLRHMDEEGIYAQVIYPNLGGFGSGKFLDLREPELMLACVRAYNDWLLEWCSADSRRLLPVMATPFWDLDEAIREVQRCAGLGHRAVLFGSQPEVFGQPPLVDRHWDRLFAAVQETGLPVSFHIGSGDNSGLLSGRGGLGIRTGLARSSAELFMENARCIADLIFGGVCHRFPDLQFVSVESGVSWLLFALDAFDWQWVENGVTTEHPEYDLLPSEYFRRQIHACFWFEERGIERTAELFPGNLLFETDYPHPTSMTPGPASGASHPRDYADRALGRLPEATVRKLVQDNAAALYGVELP